VQVGDFSGKTSIVPHQVQKAVDIFELFKKIHTDSSGRLEETGNDEFNKITSINFNNQADARQYLQFAQNAVQGTDTPLFVNVDVETQFTAALNQPLNTSKSAGRIP
jgi:hypothetical protein